VVVGTLVVFGESNQNDESRGTGQQAERHRTVRVRTAQIIVCNLLK